MSWLSGYVYQKKCTVLATTAGAQTNYQLELKVGESSGAAGEDVDCESHCQDFPNDIRFTKEDGETKHDYWIESITGTTPNRLAIVIIEVASIPASGFVDFYMYYGKSGDSGESEGNDTFEFFDDNFSNITPWANGTDTIFSGLRMGETSVVVEGDTAHCWTGAGANHQSLEYSYANDSKCAVYTQYPGNPVMTNIRFPEVIKEGDTYYLFSHRTDIDGILGDVYLWNSTDKVTWNIMNNGNPVLEHSTNPADWNYRIANVNVCVVDGVWHMLFDGTTGDDPIVEWKDHYTYSNLTDLNWTTNVVVILDNIGCPDMTHVPDRNALMVLTCTGDNIMQSKAYYASLSDNLSLPESWHEGVFELGTDVSDSVFAVVGPDKDHNIIYHYYRQGGPNYQKYSDLSLNEFYDAISGTAKWTVIDSPEVSDSKITFDSDAERIISKTAIANNDFIQSWKGSISAEGAGTLLGGTCNGSGYTFGTTIISQCAPNFYRLISDDWGHVVDLALDGNEHVYELVKLGATSAKLYVDGVLKGTLTDGLNANAKYPVFGYSAAGCTGSVVVDWVCVRKYASPEPTWGSWGAEQGVTMELYDSDTGSGVDAALGVIAARIEAETGVGADQMLSSLSSRSESDVGSGVDAIVELFKCIEKYSSDTGIGTDAIVEQLAALIETETGSGVEAEDEHKATLLQTETGVGAEEGIIGLSGSDVGIGIDSLSDLLCNLEDAEIGSGVDAVNEILASLNDSDTGSGSEALSSLLGELSNSDVGVGSDSLVNLLAAITESDLGSGIETEIRVIWIYLLLKLLQKKKLNILISQNKKKLNVKLSQEQK